MRCGRAGSTTTAAALWCRTVSGTGILRPPPVTAPDPACAAGTAATTFTRSISISVRNYTDERLAELDARLRIPYGGGLYTKYEITQIPAGAGARRVRKYKRCYLAETAAGVDAGQSAAKLKAARQQLSAFLAKKPGGWTAQGRRCRSFGQGKRNRRMQTRNAIQPLQVVYWTHQTGLV